MRNKFIGYLMGILCHLSFALAIGLMAHSLFNGLTSSLMPLGGRYGRQINILLVLQFPVLHSFLLTAMGRKLLLWPFPKEIAETLLTTSYALISSLQLMIVFVFWTPNTTVWFSPSNNWYELCVLMYCFSWLLLAKSLAEAGIAMHTGLLGWRAVVSGTKLSYPAVPTKGLHYQCRHPIYLSFSLIILTAPVWGFDHFMLATVWVLYCLVGPKFKEKRIMRRPGGKYEAIKLSTPYILPRFLRIRPYLPDFFRKIFQGKRIRHL